MAYHCANSPVCRAFCGHFVSKKGLTQEESATHASGSEATITRIANLVYVRCIISLFCNVFYELSPSFSTGLSTICVSRTLSRLSTVHVSLGIAPINPNPLVLLSTSLTLLSICSNWWIVSWSNPAISARKSRLCVI